MSSGRSKNQEEGLRWFQTAEADLAGAEWSQQGEFFHTACFQAQQAAEKSLKALLLSRGERQVRGHSAVDLLKRCIALEPSLAVLLPDCRVLDRHYIPTRYPDALPDGGPKDAFGPEDAVDAISRARAVLQAVREKIGIE